MGAREQHAVKVLQDALTKSYENNCPIKTGDGENTPWCSHIRRPYKRSDKRSVAAILPRYREDLRSREASESSDQRPNLEGGLT